MMFLSTKALVASALQALVQLHLLRIISFYSIRGYLIQFLRKMIINILNFPICNILLPLQSTCNCCACSTFLYFAKQNFKPKIAIPNDCIFDMLCYFTNKDFQFSRLSVAHFFRWRLLLVRALRITFKGPYPALMYVLHILDFLSHLNAKFYYINLLLSFTISCPFQAYCTLYKAWKQHQ